MKNDPSLPLSKKKKKKKDPLYGRRDWEAKC